jgi:hypothetical protein
MVFFKDLFTKSGLMVLCETPRQERCNRFRPIIKLVHIFQGTAYDALTLTPFGSCLTAMQLRAGL